VKIQTTFANSALLKWLAINREFDRNGLLSEGINLQELFSGVLHYDLPWNPNRLTARSRVDRFGQKAPEVKACLLYGADNQLTESYSTSCCARCGRSKGRQV